MSIDDEFKRNQYLLKLNNDPLGDGGQWSMVADLIKKYGIVPKKVMPDSFHSKASASMNTFLTMQLKQDFVTLTGGLETRDMLIDKMMTKIYNYLVGFLGKPPTKFDWTYKTKNGVTTLFDLTPLSLLEKTQFKPDDWISIVHDPRKENPYYEKYQIKYLGNVRAQHITWLNLPIERLVTMAKESIKNGCPVFFGCDVGADHDRETGIHDVGLFDTKTFMNHQITMTKEEKLRYFASIPSHAMVIVGFHDNNNNNNNNDNDNDNNEVVRWKIENSWGSSSGTSGFQSMSQKWFDRYVFQIVVHKYRLTVQELEIYNSDKVKVVEPWDPLGTLA
jgi:bleomycin hydrolase